MATVPTFDTFAAGEKVTAAKLNKNIRDAGNFLKNPPSLRLYQTAAQSIPNGAWTALTWDAEAEDTDGMWTTGTTATVKTPGLYVVTTTAAFSPNTTGARLVRILNGGTVTSRATCGPTPTYETSLNLSRQIRFGLNETVSVQVWQTSGAALNTYIATDSRCILEMCWISE